MANKVGLKINDNKTDYIIGRNDREYQQENLWRSRIISLGDCKYLGSIIPQNNEIKIEVNNILQVGNRCYYGLRSMFGFNYYPKILKLNYI